MAVVEDEFGGAGPVPAPSSASAVPGALSAATTTAAVPGALSAATTTAAVPGALPAATTARRSPVLVELAVIAFLGWIYDWLQNLAPLRVELARRHARAVLSLEQRLGIAPERFLDHWLAHQHVLAYIASDFYDNAIFGVTLGLAAWTWWHRPDIYRPLRNDLVLANLIGFAVFWLYPLAPPRMLPGFVDVVEKVGGLGSWHNLLISHADQLAAMPSMHLAWAVWCSLALWRLVPARRRWRWAAGIVGAAYPASTALVVLATANHYTLDVLAGAAVTAVSVVVVEAGLPAVRRARAYQRSWT
jgi:hypothetical protein